MLNYPTEYNKCFWLEEASATIGVEPNIQCLRSSTANNCLMDVKNGLADVMRIFPGSTQTNRKEFIFLM